MVTTLLRWNGAVAGRCQDTKFSAWGSWPSADREAVDCPADAGCSVPERPRRVCPGEDSWASMPLSTGTTRLAAPMRLVRSVPVHHVPVPCRTCSALYLSVRCTMVTASGSELAVPKSSTPGVAGAAGAVLTLVRSHLRWRTQEFAPFLPWGVRPARLNSG